MKMYIAAGCGIEKAYFGPSIIANHADEIFFPNVRELLKILAVLPVGSTGAERSFSCQPSVDYIHGCDRP